MAVAAFDGKIMVYALNTWNTENGVDGGSRGVSFQPIKEVSAF